MSGPVESETLTGTYEVLDHPADVRLRVRADDAMTLYDTGVVALYAVLTDGAPRPAAAHRVELDLEGSDPADLLVCLLNEVLYRLESDGDLAVGFAAAQLDADRLRGALELVRPAPDLASALLEVKAATYSELRWESEGDGLLAEITLDL